MIVQNRIECFADLWVAFAVNEGIVAISCVKSIWFTALEKQKVYAPCIAFWSWRQTRMLARQRPNNSHHERHTLIGWSSRLEKVESEAQHSLFGRGKPPSVPGARK